MLLLSSLLLSITILFIWAFNVYYIKYKQYNSIVIMVVLVKYCVIYIIIQLYIYIGVI